MVGWTREVYGVLQREILCILSPPPSKSIYNLNNDGAVILHLQSYSYHRQDDSQHIYPK